MRSPSLARKQRYALASCNAGQVQVIDARKLARQFGKNRDLWFVNVEAAIVLLEDPRYWKQARHESVPRHGFVRGSEPKACVRNTEHYYSVFSAAAPPG